LLGARVARDGYDGVAEPQETASEHAPELTETDDDD
jgi:hypothetical protein